MDSSHEELAKTLLLSTWERYDRAVSQLGIGVALALLLHLQVSQYLDLSGRAARTAASSEELATVRSKVDDIRTGVDDLRKFLQTAPKELFNDFGGKLHARFEALDAEYPKHLMPALRASVRPDWKENSEVGGSKPRTDITTQGLTNPLQGEPNTLEPIELSEESVRELSKANSLEDLQHALRGIAEKDLIKPFFDELNSDWTQKWQPKAETRVADILEKVDAARKGFTPAGQSWQAVVQPLEQVRTTLSAFKFKQPESSDWWKTVGGKIATGLALSEKAGEELTKHFPSEAFQAMQRELDETLSAQRELVAALKTETKSLQTQFDQLSKKADVLGKPFAWISLDLKTTAEHLPLLIGIFGAAALAWLSYWQARLFRVAAWLHVSKGDAEALGSIPLPAGGRMGTRQLTPVLLGLVGLLWVSVAGWQLYHSGINNARFVGSEWATGAVIVCVGVAYSMTLFSHAASVQKAP